LTECAGAAVVATFRAALWTVFAAGLAAAGTVSVDGTGFWQAAKLTAAILIARLARQPRCIHKIDMKTSQSTKKAERKAPPICGQSKPTAFALPNCAKKRLLRRTIRI